MRREHKIRVWRCIAFVGLFLCFLLGLGVGAHAQNANDILGKAAAAYENSNGISASFTMFTRSAGQNAGESFAPPHQHCNKCSDQCSYSEPGDWFKHCDADMNKQLPACIQAGERF